MSEPTSLYRRHRFPAEIISHCVWLYYRLPISFLWRAVDQDGTVLAILVQSRRNATAAKKVFRTRLKGVCFVPRVLITDKRASYGVAHKDMLSSTEHRRSTYVNNRVENSPQPTRQTERARTRFPSPGHAHRFLSAFSDSSSHCRPRRHRLPARASQIERASCLQVWRDITGTVAA